MTITSFTPVSAAIGGALIGVAASILLLVNGRIAGISGIFGELLRGNVRGPERFRIAFLGGLVVAGIVLGFANRFGDLGEVVGSPRPHALAIGAIAGAIVGYGTRLGGGCTSGHGVCGMSRLSPRSIVATLTFMGTAMLTVFVMRHIAGGAP